MHLNYNKLYSWAMMLNIMHLNYNKLYSWATSQYLSTSGFKGLSEKAIDKVNLAEYREENEYGFNS